MVIVTHYKWLRLNPDFNIAKRRQTLEWGKISAEYFNGENGVELTFFFGPEKIKTYQSKVVSMDWITATIQKFLGSKFLDVHIKEDDDPLSFSEMTEKYEELTS